MKPKLVWKDSFQSPGENATSPVLGSDSDAAAHSGGGWVGASLFKNNKPALHPLSRKNHELGGWGRAQGNQTQKTEARAP